MNFNITQKMLLRYHFFNLKTKKQLSSNPFPPYFDLSGSKKLKRGSQETKQTKGDQSKKKKHDDGNDNQGGGLL